MILHRQVILKALVTEDLKAQLIAEAEEAVQRVSDATEELEKQSRRVMLELQRTDLQRAMAFRQQLETEKKKHEEAHQQLSAQLEEYQNLELGSELVRGTVDGQVELAIGDNLFQKMGEAEIVVEDGVIKEFREPGND